MRLWPFTRASESEQQVQTSAAPARSWAMELDDRGVRFSGSIDAPQELLGHMLGEVSSRRIGRQDALKASAVLRARNLIAGVPATLPLELRDQKSRELIEDRNWLGEEPNPRIATSVMLSQTFEDLLFEGVSYWKVTRRLSAGTERLGFPVEARHVDLTAVSRHVVLGQPSRNISRDLQFAPDDPVFIDGVLQDPEDIIMFVSPHPPLLVHAAKHIRTVLLLDQIAADYSTDPLPFGFFQDNEELGITEEDTLSDDEIREWLSRWESARKSHRWGYVPSSMKLQQLEWPTPAELQLSEARNHAVMEIARATGLDPEDMGIQISGGSRTYVNAEQRRLDLVDFNLVTFITAVQQRLSMNDVLPRGLAARFDVSAFTRADFKTRMEAGKVAVESKIHTVNELRRKEWEPDLPESELKPPPPPPVPPQPDGNGQEPPAQPPVPVGSNGSNGSNGNGQR